MACSQLTIRFLRVGFSVADPLIEFVGIHSKRLWNSNLQARLWILLWNDLALDSRRKKPVQRRSRISESMRDRELKLALRAPVYNKSNSESAQKYSSYRNGARNPAIHRLRRRSPRRRRRDPASEF